MNDEIRPFCEWLLKECESRLVVRMKIVFEEREAKRFILGTHFNLFCGKQHELPAHYHIYIPRNFSLHGAKCIYTPNIRGVELERLFTMFTISERCENWLDREQVVGTYHCQNGHYTMPCQVGHTVRHELAELYGFLTAWHMCSSMADAVYRLPMLPEVLEKLAGLNKQLLKEVGAQLRTLREIADFAAIDDV